MHCWWMRSFIWGEGGEKTVWRSRQVDPQWLTVMLPVRQAHAMRLSSWRQINFSPNSPPLPPSTTTNPIPSHLIHFPLPSSWQHLISSRPSQWSLSGISSTVLDHTPPSHLTVLFAGSLGGWFVLILTCSAPGPTSLRRHDSPSLKPGWVTPHWTSRSRICSQWNCRCSSLVAMLDNCLVTIASHIQKDIKVLQVCFTLTVAFKEPFYHSVFLGFSKETCHKLAHCCWKQEHYLQAQHYDDDKPSLLVP